MLTKIQVIKQEETGNVKIILTDHSDRCYRHTLFMVQKVVEYGAELIEVNPYGCIIAHTQGNREAFCKYLNDYICEEYLVEDTFNLARPLSITYYIE